jgi:hypothetical protein
MKAYIVIRLEAHELDEAIGIIMEDGLEAAKAHYTNLQDEMDKTIAIVLRPAEVGLSGGIIGEDIVFWGNK